MEVFKIQKSVRTIGPNQGRPCFRVGMGFGGLKLNAEDLIKKLTHLGLRSKSLVSIYGNPINEYGIKEFITSLAALKVDSEVECYSDTKDPSWLSTVGSWVVTWTPKGAFNIKALRNRQDLVICQDLEHLPTFIEETDKLFLYRGVFATSESQESEFLEKLIGTNIRIFLEEKD